MNLRYKHKLVKKNTAVFPELTNNVIEAKATNQCENELQLELMAGNRRDSRDTTQT